MSVMAATMTYGERIYIATDSHHGMRFVGAPNSYHPKAAHMFIHFVGVAMCQESDNCVVGIILVARNTRVGMEVLPYLSNTLAIVFIAHRYNQFLIF